MTREEYNKLKDKAYILSENRFDEMEEKDWCYMSLNPLYSDEAIEENVKKLSEYDKVKIYKRTTRVRGIYSYYAMVK